MVIFITSFLVILLAMLAMGIGLFFRKKGITGTCSEMSNMVDGEPSCEICSRQHDDIDTVLYNRNQAARKVP